MKKQIWLLLISGLVASCGAFGQQIDFAFDSSSGTYSYDAGTGYALTGTDITVDGIGSSGNPENPALSITDGSLSFSTAGQTSASGWSWGDGGTLTLTGCVSVSGGSCTDSSVLLSTTFSSAEIVSTGGALPFQIELGFLSGDIDSGLAADLGIDTAFTSSTLSIDIDAPSSPVGGTFSDAGGSGTGSFTIVTSPSTTTESVPEDWSIFSSLGILAFGVAVFGVARRLDLIKPVGF